jgi:hypothetical protein
LFVIRKIFELLLLLLLRLDAVVVVVLGGPISLKPTVVVRDGRWFFFVNGMMVAFVLQKRLGREGYLHVIPFNNKIGGR